MDRLTKIFHYLSWPAVCGVLIAVVVLQYQQLERLSNIDSLPRVLVQPQPVPTLSFATAIASASPSVVSINATSLNVGSVTRSTINRVDFLLEESASLGSGVIINADGFILTNLHVVDTLFDAFDTAVTLKDGRRTPAKVVAWDKANDLAILHINLDNLDAIEIADVSKLEVGDIVFAIGYPRNIGQSVSQGIVSAITRNTDQSISILQTDAAINPGNSGGALIDTTGKLLGINSSIFSESGNFEGIGFATPSSSAIAATLDMISGAIAANSGYLGVLTGEALNEQSSELFFGVNNIRGMLVENVDEGGAAQRAGIRAGDVITRVGNTTVIDGQNIVTEIRTKKPGDTIEIEVYREGRTIALPTTLGFGQAVIIEL
ncbi:MAG: S1-C subfamily serine protease [Pseudohongiellaceae bacterium]|jgi:S1-C subfamily serine protease